jgi:signal transduction histidine kinase
VDAGTLEPVLSQFAADFDVLKADESVASLLERLDADFETGCTRVLPLLSSDGVAGLLIFEFRYPVPEEQLKERFEPATKAGAAILSVITHSRGNEELAERLVAGLGSLPLSRASMPAGGDTMSVLTELAAGAAHEMNNPLSVISGRAQFLSRTEIDPERKRTLAAIQKNAGDLSGIIDDLMSYASPPSPKRAEVGAAQIIDEAAQLAAVKTGVQNLGVEKEIAHENLAAFVDSAQVVSAIANIIANAVESYEEGRGPVKVSASAQNEEMVEFKIADNGCGMDSETLEKATHPFFSAKPAGRKRGMGLAHALRLIELNGGSLRIESAAGTGTTVTISLPRK